jgi:hypothetical protein
VLWVFNQVLYRDESCRCLCAFFVPLQPAILIYYSITLIINFVLGYTLAYRYSIRLLSSGVSLFDTPVVFKRIAIRYACRLKYRCRYVFNQHYVDSLPVPHHT